MNIIDLFFDNFCGYLILIMNDYLMIICDFCTLFIWFICDYSKIIRLIIWTAYLLELFDPACNYSNLFVIIW